MKPRRGDILFPVQGNQQKEMSPLRGSGIQMTDVFYRDIAALRLVFARMISESTGGSARGLSTAGAKFG